MGEEIASSRAKDIRISLGIGWIVRNLLKEVGVKPDVNLQIQQVDILSPITEADVELMYAEIPADNRQQVWRKSQEYYNQYRAETSQFTEKEKDRADLTTIHNKYNQQIWENDLLTEIQRKRVSCLFNLHVATNDDVFSQFFRSSEYGLYIVANHGDTFIVETDKPSLKGDIASMPRSIVQSLKGFMTENEMRHKHGSRIRLDSNIDNPDYRDSRHFCLARAEEAINKIADTHYNSKSAEIKRIQERAVGLGEQVHRRGRWIDRVVGRLSPLDPSDYFEKRTTSGEQYARLYRVKYRSSGD